MQRYKINFALGEAVVEIVKTYKYPDIIRKKGTICLVRDVKTKHTDGVGFELLTPIISTGRRPERRMRMAKDYYREWSYRDRCDAYKEGDRKGVEQYDRDSESSDRAYERWRNGGEYSDPNPDGRFH